MGFRFPFGMPLPHRKPVECEFCVETLAAFVEVVKENKRLSSELAIERTYNAPVARKR